MVSGYCYFVGGGGGNVHGFLVCADVATVIGVDENVDGGVVIGADSHQSSDVLGVSGCVVTGAGAHQSSDAVAGVARSSDEVVSAAGGDSEVVGVAAVDSEVVGVVGADEGVVIVADIVEIVGVCGCGVVGRLTTLHPRKSLTLFILWQ